MELDRCCTRVVSGSRGGVVIAAAVVVEDLIITIIAEVIMSKGMVDKNNADASGHDQVLLLPNDTVVLLALCVPRMRANPRWCPSPLIPVRAGFR